MTENLSNSFINLIVFITSIILIYASNYNIDTIVTLFVGGLILIVYSKQKKDERQNAATILIMEIRFAEKQLTILKSNPLKLDDPPVFMNYNHWNEYSHYFANELDSDELDLINEFYLSCTSLDKAISDIQVSHQLAYKAQALHNTLSQLASEVEDKESFLKKKNDFLAIIEPDGFFSMPQSKLNVIDVVLKNIRFITTSSAGQKIKKIAKKTN